MAAPQSDFTRWLTGKALSGESVSLPSGTLTLTDEVQFSKVGQIIAGEGLDRTTISFVGPAASRGLRFVAGAIAYRVTALTIAGNGQVSGVGLGDWKPPGSSQTGSNTNGSLWDHVRFTGFTTPVQIGSDALAIASSDMTFRGCRWDACTTGVQIQGGGNSLNIKFDSPAFYAMGCGIDITAGGNIRVTGTGSATGMTGPVMRVQSGGNFEVSGFRLEDSPGVGDGSGLLIHQPNVSGAVAVLTANNNEVVGLPAANRWAVAATGNTVVHLTGNSFLSSGGVRYTGGSGASYGRLVANGNLFYGPMTLNVSGSYPLTVRAMQNLAVNSDNTLTGSPVIADV